jgi:hypothetical protein
VSRRLHILPDGLKWGDISWEPTWEEKALDWNRQQIQLALAAVKRIELEEQRVWLEAQRRRLAQVALEIDETARKFALAEAKERQLAWFRDQAEQGADEMKKLMEAYQRELDAPTYKKLLARVERAGREIARDSARIDRLELLRRGVVRGWRK